MKINSTSGSSINRWVCPVIHNAVTKKGHSMKYISLYKTIQFSKTSFTLQRAILSDRLVTTNFKTTIITGLIMWNS